MRGALEIVKHYKSGEMHPNEIFEIHEEISRLPDEEIEKYTKSGIGDAIEMGYITAVEMKKNGTWNAYVEKWERDKIKTHRELLKQYMNDRGIEEIIPIN